MFHFSPLQGSVSRPIQGPHCQWETATVNGKVNGKCSELERLYLPFRDMYLPKCCIMIPNTVREVNIFYKDGRERPWKH